MQVKFLIIRFSIFPGIKDLDVLIISISMTCCWIPSYLQQELKQYQNITLLKHETINFSLGEQTTVITRLLKQTGVLLGYPWGSMHNVLIYLVSLGRSHFSLTGYPQSHLVLFLQKDNNKKKTMWSEQRTKNNKLGLQRDWCIDSGFTETLLWPTGSHNATDGQKVKRLYSARKQLWSEQRIRVPSL